MIWVDGQAELLPWDLDNEDEDIRAPHPKKLERRPDVLLRVDHVDPVTIGQSLDLLGKIGLGVTDDIIRPRLPGQRFFFLPDNSPSALAIAKGRSSSIRLNAVLRKLSVTTLSKNQQIFLAWTSTTLQPADYLTRSALVEDMRRKFEHDGEEEEY